MLNIFDFFTVWVFILVLLHKFTHKIVSLPFLTFIVMFNGLYFSYISPGKFVLKDCNTKYELNVYEKLLVDMFCHIGIFMYIYVVYGIESIFNKKILPTVLLLALYGTLYYPPDIYLIPIEEIVTVFLFSIFLYILLSYKFV